MSVRFARPILLPLLFLLAVSPAAAAGDTLSRYQLHKVERMLKEQLSCLGCHRFGAEGGWIAPDLLQLKYRLNEAQVRNMIMDPQAARPGTMMPRVRLREDRLQRLVAYLFQHGHPRAEEPPVRREVRPAATGGTGQVLFTRYCAACHGPQGGGDGVNAAALAPAPTRLSDAAALGRRSDDTLFDIIAGGGRVFDLSHRMPPWGQTLAQDDILDLVSYLRHLCECQGPAWSSDGGRQ